MCGTALSYNNVVMWSYDELSCWSCGRPGMVLVWANDVGVVVEWWGTGRVTVMVWSMGRSWGGGGCNWNGFVMLLCDGHVVSGGVVFVCGHVVIMQQLQLTL
mgnify:CR=1 FL=1